MDLVIFHYHFDSGGVAGVVARAVRAFREGLGGEIGSIRLVSGRSAEALAAGLECSSVTWPELDYLDPDAYTSGRAVADAREEAGRLAERLRMSFGGRDTLWWIHNHHLGKNPVLTQALLEIAAACPEQRMLLQIHDFPERARFDNLRFLRRIITLPPYPLGRGVHYAVLNPVDHRLLLASGVPAERVTLLENPLAPYHSGARDRPGLRRLLAASSGAFSFRPEDHLLLYPIRAIRRKNVLEAVLLTRLLGEDCTLAVTLPGTSKAERPYSELLEQTYSKGRVRGLWKIGTFLEELGVSFADLIAAADMVISTSVQEGFGYLFANTLQWGLPLAARDLDTLEGLKSLFRGYPACFYDNLACPLDAARLARLSKLYKRKLAGLADLLPRGMLTNLENEFTRLFAAGDVDFSYLPPDLQAGVLKALDSESTLERLREANAGLIRGIRVLLDSSLPEAAHMREQVEERFGYAGYARRFRRLCQTWPQPAAPARVAEADIAEAVMAACLNKESIRILYD
jgi:hypothetical protein